jgi:UDP-GlcNAc3NAcA epimerase
LSPSSAQAPVSFAIAEHNRLTSYSSRIIEVIVHTGQHFDADMSDVFFKELDIPRPDNNLGINSASRGAMMGRMLGNFEEILIKKTRTGSLFLEIPTSPSPGRLPR